MTATLTSVALANGAVRVAGIAELEPVSEGFALHRVPAWARAQYNDVSFDFMESMPAGGRIEFISDATVVELDAFLTMLRIGELPSIAGVFEVFVDGERAGEFLSREGLTYVVDPFTGATTIEAGNAITVRFEGLPTREKRVSIWLPHAAQVRLIDLRVDGSVTPAEPVGARWVHYGSSISHCLEAERPSETWPATAARLAGANLVSFGFGGQCHLDPFVGRMIAAEPADLISLKLGINVINRDSMRDRTFVPALHGLLDTIRDAHPTAPVVVITPIICPPAEDHPGPTVIGDDNRWTVTPRPAPLAEGALTLARIRELEADVVGARRKAGDENLHLLQGTDLFGAEDLHDLPDNLHPNAAGYLRMGERFYQQVFQGGPFAVKR